jgi:shikimate kinase
MMDGHLILVGLAGAGKSTLGAVAAERLGVPLLDFDSEIEKKEGLTVSGIFARSGERYFRYLERTLTEELVEAPPMVLAPGGGWVTNAGVVALLRPPGRMIYLRASPAAALHRLGSAHTTRPLLTRPDPLAEITRLFDERDQAYQSADYVVDTEVIDIESVIGKVVELASTSGRG